MGNSLFYIKNSLGWSEGSELPQLTVQSVTDWTPVLHFPPLSLLHLTSLKRKKIKIKKRKEYSQGLGLHLCDKVLNCSVMIFLKFFDTRVSCSPDWSWTHHVAEDNHDFWSSCLFLSRAVITDVNHHTQMRAMNFLLDFSRSHILKVKIYEIKCINILCLSNIQNKVLTCNLFLLFYNLYFLVSMYGVLPTCISIYYMHGVPEQVRRASQTCWD